MLMPGRKYSSGKYRYGFNSQEKSTEINDNLYTATYWEYDSRIGKRWNVDPILKIWESPYATFGGNPILNIDPDGADWYKDTKGADKGQVRWYEGSGKRKGMSHIGSTYDGYTRESSGNRWMNGNDKGEKTIWLDPVTVTAKKNADYSLMARAYPHFKEITSTNVKIWNEAQWLYNERKDAGSQLIQGGETDYYLSHQKFLQSSYLAEKDYRNMQLAVVGIMAAPAVVGLAPEAFAATMTTRLVSVGGDATVQYVSNIPQYGFGINNLNQMNITSLGASFIAPNSALMSSFIGNGFSYSIGGGYGGLNANSNNINVFSNILIGYGGNKIGNHYNSLLKNPTSISSQIRANLMGNFHGNLIQQIKDGYIRLNQ